MIKVFDTTKEFETYSADGLKSGELCYVTEDKTAHFRTNNIDGVDKDYNMSEGGGSSEPEYNELTITVDPYILNCSLGDSYEIYNPNNVALQLGCFNARDTSVWSLQSGNYTYQYITANNGGSYGANLGIFDHIIIDVDWSQYSDSDGSYTFYYRKIH